MTNHSALSVREIQEGDIGSIVGYWLDSDHAFLVSMGVDLSKLPTHEGLSHMLLEQLNTSIEKKRSYCIIWLFNNVPIGHCNTNPTHYGEDAFMHLHIWNSNARKQGIGTALVKKTLPYFFENLKLKKLFSEPYALNPAPNKTLEKAGFDFIKEYITTPGSLNFEQPVNRWEMTVEKYSNLYR